MRIAPLLLFSLAAMSDAAFLRGLQKEQKMERKNRMLAMGGQGGKNTPCNAETVAGVFQDPSLVTALSANCDPNAIDRTDDDIACWTGPPYSGAVAPQYAGLSDCDSATACPGETCYVVNFCGGICAVDLTEVQGIVGVDVGVDSVKKYCTVIP